MSDVEIRSGNAGDVSFIFNSWLKSYRDSPSVRNIPNTEYFDNQHKIIDALVNPNQTPNSILVIACRKDDPSNILGYLLGETSKEYGVDNLYLHWVYCKHQYRNQGIGTLLEKFAINLVKPTRIWYTHYTKILEKLLKSRSYRYNPYKVWSKYE